MTHDWGRLWDFFVKFQLLSKTLSMKTIGCYYMRLVRHGGAM
jgi:hypothetical protein